MSFTDTENINTKLMDADKLWHTKKKKIQISFQTIATKQILHNCLHLHIRIRP